MATPTAIVAYLALFAAVGFLFLFVNLLIGKLVRPALPNAEKREVYECGEPTIGSSFVQFDLRFYVVALLFIIFDVEVAFFFPWATVFGKATELAAHDVPVLAAEVDPAAPADQLSGVALARLRELGVTDTSLLPAAEATVSFRQSARTLALLSIADIAVFFGVLMVGFAYVWKRGDLDWVRSVARQEKRATHRGPPTPALESSTSILSA